MRRPCTISWRRPFLAIPITSDMADERGPDSVKTKADVLKYLNDSFVQLKKAAATIDEKNAFVAMKIGSESVSDTRMDRCSSP